MLYDNSDMGTPEDLILWKNFKEGNQESLDLIFDRYVKLLYSYGYRIFPDSFLIEDCIQDLFLKLWTNRNTLGDTANVKFYLIKALKRMILRKLSQENKYQGLQKISEDYDFQIEFSHEFHLINDQISMEKKEKLSSALELLSKRQREIIYHKYYHNLSYEEISEVMSLNINSVYNLMNRALEALTILIKNPAVVSFLFFLSFSA